MSQERISAVIVDDEEHCSAVLELLLKQHCPDIDIIRVFNSSPNALKFLKEESPDVIFLDIEMPELNAFDLLKELPNCKSAIVFTTAYDQFALKAIKLSTLDYLLKPIDKDDLAEAVVKVRNRKASQSVQLNIDKLITLMAEPADTGLLSIPSRDGLELIKTSEIEFVKADDNYSEIHMLNGERKVVTYTLKKMESLLNAQEFMRVHQSYVVNTQSIRKYIRGQGGYLVLASDQQIPVSRARKADLLARIAN